MSNLIEKICNKYNLSEWAANERIRLLKDTFNFSDQIIDSLINTNEKLFTCFAGDILEAKNLLKNQLNFSEEHIKTFVQQSDNFPFITHSINEIGEKINMLNSYGISLDDIALNFEILKKNKKID